MSLDTQERVIKRCSQHAWTIADYLYEERYEDRWVLWVCESCGTERRIPSPALGGASPR